MGNDSLLAFFEIPKGKEPAGNRNAIGVMQHCAFVVTAERVREVEARLKAHGIDHIGPIAQLPGLLGAPPGSSDNGVSGGAHDWVKVPQMRSVAPLDSISAASKY